MSRRSGRLIVTGLLAVAFAISGVGIWMLFRGKPTPADFLEVVALDGEYALVVRDLSDGDRRDFFSLYHVHEGERWGALIPPYLHAPGRLGIAASPNVATIRVARDGDSQVLGFAMHGPLKAGRLSVADPRPPSPDAYALPDVATVSDVTHAFELFRLGGDAGGIEVTATEIDRGTLLWRQQVPGATAPAWLRPGALILSLPDGLAVLDRKDGAIRTIAVPPGATVAPCILDTVVLVEGVADFAGRCGRRGDAILLATESGGHAWVVAVDATTHAVRWRTDLGAGSFALPGMDLQRRRSPDADPFSGALPPTLPILVGDAAGTARMIALDTTTGAITGTTPPHADLATARLLRDADRSYLFVPATSLLVSFEPGGRISGIASTAGYREVWPAQVAETHVWLYDARRLVVLDGVDLSVTAASTTPPPALDDPTLAAARLGLPVPAAP